MLRGVVVVLLLCPLLYYCALSLSDEMDRVTCDASYKGHPNEYEKCKPSVPKQGM